MSQEPMNRSLPPSCDDPPEGDTSEPTKCLSCSETIAVGTTSCSACAWSYKPDAQAPSRCAEIPNDQAGTARRTIGSLVAEILFLFGIVAVLVCVALLLQRLERDENSRRWKELQQAKQLEKRLMLQRAFDDRVRALKEKGYTDIRLVTVDGPGLPYPTPIPAKIVADAQNVELAFRTSDGTEQKLMWHWYGLEKRWLSWREYMHERGPEYETRVGIRTILYSMEQYRNKRGRFPTMAEGLQALTSLRKRADAWGRDLRYEFPCRHGTNTCDISSAGADGAFDTSDDIRLCYVRP